MPPRADDPVTVDDELIPTRASLLARLKDWDNHHSWKDFFDTYWRLIYHHASHAGLNDQQAQEVVQETIIAVARQMKDFNYDPDIASFKTWLYRIVQRRIADQFRKEARHAANIQALSDDEPGTNALEQIPDPASLEPDAAWNAEWESNLASAAAERVKRQVKQRHFQIFEYHVLQGHSAPKTANDLKTNAATVYWIKHRVGRRLRREVDRLRDQLL
ncbi:MAG: sigma-70 family RNA polymerase sigma factor [Verrucomicrobiota bacterium]